MFFLPYTSCLFLHILFQFCWGYSGYLVEIEDHTEDRALDEFLGKFDCFWIGLHDEAVEGLYRVARPKTIHIHLKTPNEKFNIYTFCEGKWEWDASHNVAQYYYWARAIGDYPDEPTMGPGEDCVFKTLDNSKGKGWSDYDCNAREAKGMYCYALCQFGAVPIHNKVK